jgi:hypothetical protein
MAPPLSLRVRLNRSEDGDASNWFVIWLWVSHDVCNAAYLSLQVLQLIAAGVEVDNAYGFFGICRNDESIHASA